MAERRMFTNKITESDAFLEMSLTSQSLYFHLCMNADDDGFVKNPKRICRMIGANDDDLKLLIAKSFVLNYESGVIVIKHWRMHNLLRKDRYNPTEYIEERSMLYLKENGAYTLDGAQGTPLDEKVSLATTRQPNDNQLATQCSVGKDSIGKVSKGKDSIGSSNEPSPVVIKLLLKNGTEYGVTQSMIDEYKQDYPHVNVEQELRFMRSWCNANPAKRKTKAGVNRFITNWLSKEEKFKSEHEDTGSSDPLGGWGK